MKKHKVLIEIVIFVVLLSLMVAGCYDVLRYKDTGDLGGHGRLYDNYYDIDVPIDVMVYGASHAGCTVDNSLLWKESGIASFTLSSGAQQAFGTYYYMKDSFRHNKPKIALVETALMGTDEPEDDTLYRSTLVPHFSASFVPYILDFASRHEMDRETVEELILRMPIVHSRYTELARGDVVNETRYSLGYIGDNTVTPCEPPAVTDRREPLPENAVYYMDRIMQLCDDSGVQLVFFNAPFSATEEERALQNSVRDYITEKGYPYIGFMDEDAPCTIDYGTDLREYSHLNNNGAAKVTRALAEYMLANYELTDRRDDPDYALWDLHSRFMEDRELGYALKAAPDPATYLYTLAADTRGCTYIISLNGFFNALGDDLLLPGLNAVGIDVASYANGGVFVVRNGEIVSTTPAAEEYSVYVPMENDSDLNIWRNAGDEFATIRLDATDLSPDKNGISVAVYDESCSYLIDSMYVDVFLGTDVRRDE